MMKSHFTRKAVAIILVSALCIEVTHLANGTCNQLPDLTAECDAGLMELVFIAQVQECNCPNALCMFNAIQDTESKMEDLTIKIYDDNPKNTRGQLKCSLDLSKEQQVTVMSTLTLAIGKLKTAEAKETLAVADRAYKLLNDGELSNHIKYPLRKAFNKLGPVARYISGGKPVCLITPFFNNGEKVFTRKEPGDSYTKVGTNRNKSSGIGNDEYPLIFEIAEDGCYFAIKSKKTGEYWDTPSIGLDQDRRFVYAQAKDAITMRFPPHQWELLPFRWGTMLHIRNKYIFQYVYPFNNVKSTDQLRPLLTWSRFDYNIMRDHQFDWTVKAC